MLKNFSIRSRLVILFTLQVLIMLIVGGFYLNWRLQRTLDAELADKLEHLAQAAALQVDPDLLSGLTAGDEGTRTYRSLLAQMKSFQETTGIRRLYILKHDHTSLIDTRSDTPIGLSYPFVPITPSETDDLFTGKSLSSILFEGADGKLYKAGFAPIYAGDRVIAAIALEGSADTFEAIEQVRRDLFFLALMVLTGSILLGIVFSRTITSPIGRLKQAAEKIELGDYDTEIVAESGDEIGFLSRRMEEMRGAIVQRDIRQKTMLAGVAHEIRNPLGGIELFAGLLVSELPDGKAKSEAQKIQNEVQNLKKIVTDFLDYARPRQARRERCRVQDLVEEVRMLLETDLEGIDFRYTEEKNGSTVYVDPRHLKQILINLTINAAEVMHGSGELDFRVETNGKTTTLILSDNGPGIPENGKEKLFEPFFTTKKEGTGLGLAIVKTLVEENAGEIELWESEGRGATFVLRFAG